MADTIKSKGPGPGYMPSTIDPDDTVHYTWAGDRLTAYLHPERTATVAGAYALQQLAGSEAAASETTASGMPALPKGATAAKLPDGSGGFKYGYTDSDGAFHEL